jgi:hypothetical protein
MENMRSIAVATTGPVGTTAQLRPAAIGGSFTTTPGGRPFSVLPTAVLSLWVASVAHAACPTAADLDGGIRFDLASEEWEVFIRTGDGLVQADFFYDDGQGSRVLLAKGIYLLQVVDFEPSGLIPDTRQNFSYPLRPSEMPDPVPGGGWSVKAAVLGPEGLTEEVQVYSFGEIVPHTFGACTYDRMEITIEYPAEGEETVSRDFIHWLPELGVSFLAGYEDEQGREMYDYIAVRAGQ